MKTIPFRIFTLSCALGALLTLPSCKSTKGNEVVNYLPDGTPLPKEEYPFDDKGNYREDWVSGSSSSSASTSTVASTTPVSTTTSYADIPPIPPVTQYDDTPARPTVSSSSSKPKPKPKPVASVKPKPKPKPVASKPTPKPKPKPKPKPVVKKVVPKPTLYKIKKGDTLYGISLRTGNSVADIKRYNNMSKDLLRDGWVIKIPPKKK